MEIVVYPYYTDYPSNFLLMLRLTYSCLDIMHEIECDQYYQSASDWIDY